MKVAKITLFAILAAVVAVGVSTTSYAFHSGGVGECSGCHSMHSPATGGTYLLVGKDQSSACLSCHEHAGDTAPSSYHISTAEVDMPTGTAPLQRTPGGDFGWLKKTYTWPGRGTDPPQFEEGRTHGHNIIADDFTYVVDDNNATAPGGSFDSAKLFCTSCHDPHGKYRRFGTAITNTGAPIKASGSYSGTTVAANEPTATEAVGVYRLLAGKDYAPKSYGSAIGFTGVPAAKVPSTYNRTEATTQTRVAYGDLQVTAATGGATWSAWCGTCHGAMHEGNGGYVHKTDSGLGSTIAANYNKYIKSGDVSRTDGNSFTSLVPFAETTSSAADYAALAAHAKNDDTYLTGPTSTGKVMCLTCHRAHASGWEYAARWNLEYEFLTQAGAYPNGSFAGRGHTPAEVQAAYYDRAPTVFATYQRSLCNKCHIQD